MLASAFAHVVIFCQVHGQDAVSENLPVEVLKVSSQAPEAQVIDYAAGFIKRGEIVSVPTDTVYGLSADPFNLAAVERVFQVKGRPESRALPILVSSVEQAVTLARDVPDTFLTLAQRFWPGPLTLVVEATRRVPLKVTGNTGCVAVRWPNCLVTSALINAAGGPITGTSANISGRPSCTNAGDLVRQLGDRLSLILDAGDTGGTLASTIVKIEGDDWSIVREGDIEFADIERALNS